MSRVVTTASAAAALLTVHTAVNARLLRRPPSLPSAPPRLSVLIPARDEQARIGACLTAVLASRGCELEVVVGDDGSTDDTAGVVARMAATDERVRLLRITPPPHGRLGKPNACQQLADAAAHDTLVFVDADVVVAPDGLARTAALLDDAGLDLVSPYPRQITGTTPERLVQPLLQWSWLTFLPLRAAERWAAPTLVAANGQLLACRRRAYTAAGGHAAVAGEVIEDVALARAFKRSGLVATVADGTQLAQCRMYQGWPELRDGYTKSLWATTRTRAGSAGLAAMLAWLYVVPPTALVWRLLRARPGAAIAGAGYAAGVAGRIIAARRTGGSVAGAPWHPVSVLVALGLLARSHLARHRGRLQWKGRMLP
jgi:cellulose synthase/poly-beta-1,6-N-acetylglucosamine synthase-like glycosyltransferase